MIEIITKYVDGSIASVVLPEDNYIEVVVIHNDTQHTFISNKPVGLNVLVKEVVPTKPLPYQTGQWKTSIGAKVRLIVYGDGYSGTLEETINQIPAGKVFYFNENGYCMDGPLGYLKTARNGQESW